MLGIIEGIRLQLAVEKFHLGYRYRGQSLIPGVKKEKVRYRSSCSKRALDEEEGIRLQPVLKCKYSIL